MKKIFLLLFLFILSSNLLAQIVYTEPKYAMENDSVIVYFDASQAERRDLVGYTGDLYVHTGLTTNVGTWQHVIESWGNNNTQPQLERIATDLYKLVIGYPREFYPDVSDNETLLGMNFVFRSADGNKQTEDVFYSFYQSGITAVIDSPYVNIEYGEMKRSPLFYEINDEIGFKVKAATIGSSVDSILIYKDNSLIDYSTGIDSLIFTERATNYGNYDYQIVVKDTDGLMDSTSFNGVVIEERELMAVPEGIEPGVNFLPDGGAILAFFAPYKDIVYLIGDFNNWYVENDYLMNKDMISEDSIMFWYKFDIINEDQVYKYQYLINGKLRVADPYARLVLDPWNDSYINENVFPDMPEYPYGKTGHIVSTFEKQSDEFQWTDENYTKPAKEKLVIYELLIRDFTDEHTYNSALKKLDYLDSLGINAIELMPTMEFEGNSSWGYNPSFYFAVDKYYGSPNNLKNFVNECHQRGIAVLGDLVLNHAYDNNSMVRMYQDANYQITSESPWFNQTAPHTDFYWGFDFDHQSKHTQYFIDRVNKYWIEEFHFDGYRFDFTRGFTNKPGGSGPYDENRINILKRMSEEIWKSDSVAFVILEHLVDENSGEMKVLADYGMLLWGNMNHSYNQASMGWPEGWDFSWGYYKTRGWTEPNLITYMESHDEERLMVKNLKYGNNAGDYDIQHPYTALQRQKLVNAFFLTYPGPKMIWQFGELGYDFSIDYKGRLGEKPIRWDYLQDENRKNLYKTLQALLRLRKENDVFTSKNTYVAINTANQIKTLSLTGGCNVQIIGNFGVTDKNTQIDFVHDGIWYDFFAGDSIAVSGALDLALAPGEFHIFSDKNFKSPEENLLVEIEKEIAVPERFILYPPYPNPFNPSTNITFDIPAMGNVSIAIYNILGEKLFERKFYQLTAGNHSVQWNASDYSSGIYFIHMKSKNQSEIVRALLLK
jgi:1,4-alpha-glucan branching enzyme